MLTAYVHFRVYYWLKYKYSNISSVQSVGKHVMTKHWGTNPKTGYKAFHVGFCLWEYKMYQTKLKRYTINWSGNPYLSPEKEGQFTYHETDPLEGHIWSGSSQNRWTAIKHERLSMVGNKCETCKSTKSLNAHHIIPRKDGGKHTLKNIIILCEDCHKKVHTKS